MSGDLLMHACDLLSLVHMREAIEQECAMLQTVLKETEWLAEAYHHWSVFYHDVLDIEHGRGPESWETIRSALENFDHPVPTVLQEIGELKQQRMTVEVAMKIFESLTKRDRAEYVRQKEIGF